MLRKTVHGVNNFCYAFWSPKFHFPYQVAPCPQSLELESESIGCYPERILVAENNCLHGMNKFQCQLSTIHKVWS